MARKRLSFRVRDDLAVADRDRADPARARSSRPSPSSPRRWASRARRSARRCGPSRRTGSSRGRSGAGTYATHRPRLRNNLDVNFGVTEAIRAAGMRAGHAVRARCTPTARHRRGGGGARPRTRATRSSRSSGCAPPTGAPVVFSRRRRVRRDASVPPNWRRCRSTARVYELFERHGTLGGARHRDASSPPEPIARWRSGSAVKAGALLLYLRQVDYGREGEPLLLSRRASPREAFEFTVVRRGPGRRGP